MTRPKTFPPIPFQCFRNFHRAFQGDFYERCARCGGVCEHKRIGTLLPGESYFLARARGLSVRELRARYLDQLVLGNRKADVIKLRMRCRLLDAQGRCTIARLKPVLCEIYPIVFEVQGRSIHYSIDRACPISRDRSLVRQLLEVGVPAFKALPIPFEFMRLLSRYDGLDFDYAALERGRADRPGYTRFALAEIMQFRK